MTELEEFTKLYEENGNDYELDEVEIIVEGSWEQDHKYQYKQAIVKFKDKFFSVQESRSGSYHSDWYYGDTYIQEVERHEKVVTVVEWKGVGEHKEIDAKY